MSWSKRFDTWSLYVKYRVQVSLNGKTHVASAFTSYTGLTWCELY